MCPKRSEVQVHVKAAGAVYAELAELHGQVSHVVQT